MQTIGWIQAELAVGRHLIHMKFIYLGRAKAGAGVLIGLVTFGNADIQIMHLKVTGLVFAMQSSGQIYAGQLVYQKDPVDCGFIRFCRFIR